jgi:hypothetical protein
MSTYGDIPPHVESFQEWIDENIEPANNIHVMWRPPPRCLTCGGHRVSIVKGKRPIATHKLWFWVWLAEYPMRWLARSLREMDPNTWTMEEDIPGIQFGTDIHARLEQYYRDMEKEC